MNKTDILIEKTINDYLINEGFFDWFSKKPNEEIENDDEIDSEPYTPIEINPQYNNKQNTNTNYHQNDNASNHNNNNNEYRNSILNVNEEYPLTNALIRLVRQRKIRDSKRLRSLMADLQDLGY